MIDLTGKVVAITRDYRTRKANITFEVDEEPDSIAECGDTKLSIKVCKKNPPRSLDSNSYFYVLVNKLAEKQVLSDREVHDKLLSENIAYYYKDGAIEYIITDWQANEYRLYRVGEDYYYDSLMRVLLTKPDGTPYMKDGKQKQSNIFWHIKGSHQMDTKEMHRLIQSTIADCKAEGIETATPKELEQMEALWATKQDSKLEKAQGIRAQTVNVN